MQIIDAQKVRLKRKLAGLEARLQEALARSERAETVTCQLRADLADMSAERDACACELAQRTQQLQEQVADLEDRLACVTSRNAEPGQSQALKDDQVVEVRVLCCSTLEFNICDLPRGTFCRLPGPG